VLFRSDEGGKLMRVWKTICGAAVLMVLAAPGVRADEWDKKTILTFSGPVQIPGATLPAGSYVFKLADLNGNRHVVQVFDKDEKRIVSTILAIPNDRLEPADDPLVLFAERPAGSPQAVKVWFYPGDRIGNEFVYPKSMAMKIAKANHQSVLAMDDNSSSSMFKTAQVGRFDEQGVWKPESNTTAATTTSAAATTTAPKTTTTPRANTTPESTTAQTTTAPRTNTSAQSTSPRATTAQPTTANPSTAGTTGTSGRRSTRRSLPRTASPLPLYELLSGLSLAGGLVVRRFRKAA